VTNFVIGDDVIALAAGAFRSHVTVPAERVFAKPENLSLMESASIPTAFLTAYYGLHHLAGMKKGDRVLIHAAAGGVGQAAVQLAQRAGAEVFATAGSEQKRDYLRSIGVQHVFNSRDLSFADEIMRITEGQGVHIVLNSLADEYIARSLSVLSEHGYFLEIGKRDEWDQQKVAAIYPALKYFRYDLAMEMLNDLPLVRAMLTQILADVGNGFFHALPIESFPITSARDAFRHMAQAKHIGKIVVTQEEEAPLVHSNGTYLITGGLGGLGLVAAQWLVEKGVAHLVLMSRSQPNVEVKATVDALRASGVQVVVAQGDVSKREDAEQVLRQIESEMPPLRGIIHAAGVLDDGVLSEQTWERFKTVMDPKIEGAWNLHTLTLKSVLDFFILYSAGASLFGSPGQGNYAAANSFLDGLAHYRRCLGLPALSINWGRWSEVGMASRLSSQDQQRWAGLGMNSIKPEQGMMALQHLLRQQAVQVAVLSIDWSNFGGRQGDSVQPLLRRILPENGQVTSSRVGAESPERLKSLSPVEQGQALLSYTREQVIKTFRLDPSYSFEASQLLLGLGMDSLMAVELKNRIESDLGVNIPINYFLEEASVSSLSERISLALGMDVQFQIQSQNNDDKIDAAKAQQLLESIDQLSEDEVNALLNNLLDKEDEK
jgi:myxalamid-type polyketide synthase MxaB